MIWKGFNVPEINSYWTSQGFFSQLILTGITDPRCNFTFICNKQLVYLFTMKTILLGSIIIRYRMMRIFGSLAFLSNFIMMLCKIVSGVFESVVSVVF